MACYVLYQNEFIKSILQEKCGFICCLINIIALFVLDTI